MGWILKNFRELEGVRGRFVENAPLGEKSWFGCGGSADLLFEPVDLADLGVFLRQWDGAVLVLGGMANAIIRDGGIRGCVIRLGKGFAGVEIDGERLIIGAGALNGTVAQAAAKNGLGGLEFLSGIPGTIGGAISMNAGAYGVEVGDVLLEIETMDRKGDRHILERDMLSMSYRHTAIPEGHIILKADFLGVVEDRDIVRRRLKDIKLKRRETQPITEKTGGSTFANPMGHKAWELIDAAGCRDLRIGGARMSEKHCNFMINDASAMAADLEKLGDEIIRIIGEKTGVVLEWEIRRYGSAIAKSKQPEFLEKPIFEMTDDEWESLCDGCGLCCQHSIEDEDVGGFSLTNRACEFLCLDTHLCSDYANRFENQPDCVKVTPENVSDMGWLPYSCAYRLVANGVDLPEWHYLICGDKDRVHKEGISMKGGVYQSS